jgi:hypothetical protein
MSNRELFAPLESMPALSHWPDRTVAFDYARSEVILFIMRECEVDNIRHAVSLFRQAKDSRLIVFANGTWRGKGTDEI